MTKIILIRHGHVEGITPERFRGRLDLSLTETGRRQSITAVCRPAAIYASPMSRCVATGAAIGAPLGISVQPEQRLNDIDYGAWQGLTTDVVRSKTSITWNGNCQTCAAAGQDMRFRQKSCKVLP